jgi:hypothetical protein
MMMTTTTPVTQPFWASGIDHRQMKKLKTVSFFPSHTVLSVFVAKKSDFFRPLDKKNIKKKG